MNNDSTPTKGASGGKGNVTISLNKNLKNMDLYDVIVFLMFILVKNEDYFICFSQKDEEQKQVGNFLSTVLSFNKPQAKESPEEPPLIGEKQKKNTVK